MWKVCKCGKLSHLFTDVLLKNKAEERADLLAWFSFLQDIQSNLYRKLYLRSLSYKGWKKNKTIVWLAYQKSIHFAPILAVSAFINVH
ncbi:MAG: hypothetical protein AMJ61_14705 [Desulfobacterales bacterium SG8_35_2]|nr:MAG: hypothetical protein AMJ61_14705 [Desulfobacterales bacterium SG8_35_2]